MRRAATTTVSALTLSAACALGLAAGPASADDTDTPDTADMTVDLGPAGLLADDEFFAGYRLTGDDIATGASKAVFTVPDVECGAEEEGLIITVYAFDPEGYFAAGSDLFFSCQGGELVRDGHITTSGGQIPIWQQMEAGDKIELSITKRAEGPSTHDIAFASKTRDWVSTLPTNSQIGSIEVGFRRMQIGGERVEPMAYKTKVSGVKLDGTKLASTDAEKVTLVDAEGEPMSKVRDARKARFVARFF